MPDKPAPTLLAGLGVLGWSDREAVVVAALAAESPLLLVGPHGTAKSLLLERLADALGLDLRHYNASILNFDDLVGFPVPDGDTVRYLRTPLDAWDAEAVFIDEISRCRPDMQNRLFPLVHERRLQGRALDRLRHRWAAMNTPDAYRGTEPLDAALADRFPWVLETPPSPTGPDRLALIAGPETTPDGPPRVLAAVERTRAGMAVARATWARVADAYTDVAADALAHAHLELSGRRLRMLRDNLLALLATGLVPDPRDAALLALTWSLPQRAEAVVPPERVLAAHTAARHFLDHPGDVVRRALLAERDPVRRVAIALAHDDDELLGATLLDCRASLLLDERIALAALLFGRLGRQRPDLPGVAFEALAIDARWCETVEERTQSEEWHVRARVEEVATVCGPLSEPLRRVLWAALDAQVLRPDLGSFVAFARELPVRLGLEAA